MVSKHTLGVSYLITVGVALFAILLSGVMVPADSLSVSLGPNTVFATVTGLFVASGFLVSGIGLANSKLSGERVWRVAVYSTVGLGIPTGMFLLLMMFRPETLADFGWQSVAMINIAGGGVVGILIGTVVELRSELSRTAALNQRNTVFIRLFRHDIRNNINSILGHLELIHSDPSRADESIHIIRDQMESILRLSDAARQLDELELEESQRQLDLVGVVSEELAEIRSTYPHATINTDFPSSAPVMANELLRSAVGNLVTNAIQHNEGTPKVDIRINRSEGDSSYVELRIEDNGPGFTEDELDVHRQQNETTLHHSSGIGIWLSRWIIESYDGSLCLRNGDEEGAVVTIILPSV